jgi:hypothetical protein
MRLPFLVRIGIPDAPFCLFQFFLWHSNPADGILFIMSLSPALQIVPRAAWGHMGTNSIRKRKEILQ